MVSTPCEGAREAGARPEAIPPRLVAVIAKYQKHNLADKLTTRLQRLHDCEQIIIIGSDVKMEGKDAKTDIAMHAKK